SPSCVRSRKSVTPSATSVLTSACALSAPQAQGCRPATRRPGSMTVGGRTPAVCRVPRYPVRGDRLNGGGPGADRRGMERLDASAEALRDRGLALATELGVDPGSWYVRVLEEGKREGLEPDLGALVRVYWELQRVTGRADLRDTWRALADAFWSGEA